MRKDRMNRVTGPEGSRGRGVKGSSSSKVGAGEEEGLESLRQAPGTRIRRNLTPGQDEVRGHHIKDGIQEKQEEQNVMIPVPAIPFVPSFCAQSQLCPETLYLCFSLL